ncbi:uncharacterized protein LOC115797545 [Archocentrus centrarchus]|uniref:uncharacterized protein LOC115797545 n=1 Tax=Archocentrus centrarchus TaxID=63155 RepID=UPI0011EA20CB|nr:uncharacterized protein LOC115797545 [Archocentrus centrarchus]
MSLSVLLLLLLVSSVQAAFYGLVVNYYPNSNGFSRGTLYYKLSNSFCIYNLPYSIGGESLVLNKVNEESNGGPCQTEGILTRIFSSNSIFPIPVSGLSWISGIKNGIVSFTAQAVVDLRFRSDTGSANTSPQTTIIPAVRVPSNCARNFNLLMFDPDGDVVKCRNGNMSLSECAPCTPPSVLSLSPSSCTLSFSPTNSSNEGPYAVQLMMEDFPRETITLTETGGTQTTLTTNDAIGKIPVQFVLIVDPAVPSCTEGLFLPMFLPPTPAHGAQFFTNVNETLQITISAQALNSTISELLFSGPYTVNKTQTGPGQFTLTWTPSATEAGQSHPVCFVVQAIFGANKYQSELRCVIVRAGNASNTTSPTLLPAISTTTPPINTPVYVAGLKMTLTSLGNLFQSDQDALLNQVKQVLDSYGLPEGITLRIRSIQPQVAVTAAPANATT